MQAPQAAYAARQRVLMDVRSRVHQNIGSWLKDFECVQISICASLKDPKETLDFLFRREVASMCLEKRQQIAITLHEWAALYGAVTTEGAAAVAAATGAGKAYIENLTHDCEFKSIIKRIEAALRCSTEEGDLKKTWAHPLTKAACVLAMHTDDHENLISSSIGSIVRADHRRLEELRSEIDDVDRDVIMIASVIAALAEAVS